MTVIAIATRFVPSPGWLVQLVRAGVSDWIITLLKRLLAASHNAQINEFIQLGQQLRTLDLALPLGRVIEVLTTSPTI
jgi:hypothetical protein